MKHTLSLYDFINGVRDDFSYEAAEALFTFLEEIDPEIEFDPIGIRCEWDEYTSISEYNDTYNTEHEKVEDIMNDTTVVMVDDDEHFLIIAW